MCDILLLQTLNCISQLETMRTHANHKSKLLLKVQLLLQPTEAETFIIKLHNREIFSSMFSTLYHFDNQVKCDIDKENTYDQEELQALRSSDSRLSRAELQSLAPTFCSGPWLAVTMKLVNLSKLNDTIWVVGGVKEFRSTLQRGTKKDDITTWFTKMLRGTNTHALTQTK